MSLIDQWRRLLAELETDVLEAIARWVAAELRHRHHHHRHRHHKRIIGGTIIFGRPQLRKEV